MSERPPPDDPDDDARFTISLAGLAVAILLVIAGYYVLDRLSRESKMEDCMLAGHHDCAPIAQPD